jgi:hypothetical protein
MEEERHRQEELETVKRGGTSRDDDRKLERGFLEGTENTEQEDQQV